MDDQFRWLTQLDDQSGAALVALYNDTVGQGSLLGYPQPITGDAAASVVARLNESLSRGEIEIFAAYDVAQEELIASAVLTRNQMPNCRHIAEVSKGVIRSDHQASGLLQAAFLNIAEHAKAQGIDLLTLDVRGASHPYGLWRALGFREFGVLNDYARVNGETHSGAFMYQYVGELIARLRAETPARARRAEFIPEDEFKRVLREELESRVTLTHPVIKDVLNGDANWGLLRFMTLQGYQLTKHFLEYIETLYFHCPRGVHKRRLLLNMFEEETGRFSKTANHVQLMQNFIRAVGIDDDTRDAAQALPETQALIDYRMDLVRNPYTFHMGAAAVMIGSEGQNLETAAGEARHDMLPKLYNLTEEDLRFFSVHQKEDEGHVREGISLVARICTDARMQQEALEAVRTTCDLFYGMYEGISRAWYGNEREVAGLASTSATHGGAGASQSV